MSSVKTQNASTGQSNLSKQDLATLNVAELTPLSPEVISRQATINIGTIGHVAHGKSTVVKAVSGVQTVRFKNELERNITIKLDMESMATAEPEKISVIPMQAKKSRKRKRKAILGVKGGIDNEDYEVERILAHSEHNGQVIKYRVKWKDWPEGSSTWEPFDNLRGCLETVVEYFDSKISNGVNESPLPATTDLVSSRFLTLRKELSTFTSLELEAAAKQYFTNDGDVIPPFNRKEVEEKLFILAKLPPAARDKNFVLEVRLSYLFLELKNLRNSQMEALVLWEKEINDICRGNAAPIKIVNSCDLEGPPSNFIYVSKYIPGENVIIPQNPPIGCACNNRPCTGKRCAEDHGAFGRQAYSHGRLTVNRGTPIYECNSSCKCSPNCENRVIQRGRKFPLCIFRTHTGCGWGVKTLVDIPKGSFVCQYVGEVITSREAERRGKLYDKEGATYLFDLDFNDKDNVLYTVDAKVYGNESHFINHSCSPNLEVYAVWVNCIDRDIPNLCLFASKNIKAEDELTFDYLCQPLLERLRNDITSNQTHCKCGSQNCRKFLF